MSRFLVLVEMCAQRLYHVNDLFSLYQIFLTYYNLWKFCVIVWIGRCVIYDARLLINLIEIRIWSLIIWLGLNSFSRAWGLVIKLLSFHAESEIYILNLSALLIAKVLKYGVWAYVYFRQDKSPDFLVWGFSWQVLRIITSEWLLSHLKSFTKIIFNS